MTVTADLTLIFAPPSPFARKAVVTAAEAGIALDKTPFTASPVQDNPALVAANPLGKLPALRLPSGEVLYDSPVICRYLGEGTPLFPQGKDLWRALRREALADGLLDAALLARYETTLRPEPLRWPDWLCGQMAKIHQALRGMEQDVQPRQTAPGFDIGDIATLCALGYLDFRFADLDWRAAYPALARYAQPLFARRSLQTSAPA